MKIVQMTVSQIVMAMSASASFALIACLLDVYFDCITLTLLVFNELFLIMRVYCSKLNSAGIAAYAI